MITSITINVNQCFIRVNDLAVTIPGSGRCMVMADGELLDPEDGDLMTCRWFSGSWFTQVHGSRLGPRSWNG